jgi:hypothetical protein
MSINNCDLGIIGWGAGVENTGCKDFWELPLCYCLELTNSVKEFHGTLLCKLDLRALPKFTSVVQIFSIKADKTTVASY